MKIIVKGEQCYPIAKHMAQLLNESGHTAAYAYPDVLPSGGFDVLWYVGVFGTVSDAIKEFRASNPTGKVVLQWAGSDILWCNPPIPAGFADLHVAPCFAWASEVWEKFHVPVKSIHLTPIKVHPVWKMPDRPRILIYGNWDMNGGAKYNVPLILSKIPAEVWGEAEIHVLGDGWRFLRVNRVQYHPWISDFDEKVRFFAEMSALIYMPAPHEEHRFGGFVSLSPIEFSQMGRWVIRNGDYPYLINGRQDFAKAVNLVVEVAKVGMMNKPAIRFYQKEYAPLKCENRLKEVLKELE